MKNSKKILPFDLTPTVRSKLKTILLISLSGIIIGVLYANFTFGFVLYRVYKGALIGFLITSISSTVEIFVFHPKFKRLNFSIELLTRTLFYILLISFSTIFVVVVHESIDNNTGIITTINGAYFRKFITGDFIAIFLFAVVISLTLNFLWQINRMLGKNVLVNVMLGKYRRPKLEQRVFMFLDIKSSTTLGETLGAYEYSSLLQDFFYDITDPVIETKGEVYQYIGDEVVLTWKINKKILFEYSIICFFNIKNKIKMRGDYYIEKYGVVPDFKAGAHWGEAVVTEVGDLKKEIVFHGDTVNTTARIRTEAGQQKRDLIISGTLLSKISDEFKRNIFIEEIGNIKLKGKEKEVNLFSIKKSVDSSIKNKNKTFSIL